jgi:O-antigen/teichoic acid export membrane protein
VGELLLRIPNQMLWAFSGSISAHGRDESASLVAQFCRWALILLLITAAVIGVAAPFLVPAVFGAAYRPAISSVLFLLPGMVLYAPATIIAEYFIVQRGRPGKAALIAGSSLAVSAILNIPLTPTFGAAGASMASSLSYGVMFGVAAMLFSRDAGYRPLSLLPKSLADLRSVALAMRTVLKREKIQP